MVSAAVEDRAAGAIDCGNNPQDGPNNITPASIASVARPRSKRLLSILTGNDVDGVPHPKRRGASSTRSPNPQDDQLDRVAANHHASPIANQNKARSFDHAYARSSNESNLVASGIVALQVEDKSKIGTDKLTQNDVYVTLPNGVDTDGLSLPAYMIPSYYDNLNTGNTYHF